MTVVSRSTRARVPHPSGRRALSLRAWSLLAAAAGSAACGTDNDAPQSTVERAVALAPAVEQATGLRFKTPPKVEVRSKEQVRAFVQRAATEPDAKVELASLAVAYKRFGLLPDTLDLPALLARVLEEQVVGYYDPRTTTLYVVQGADSLTADLTLRHELVHALQDQYQPLDSLLRVRGQGDRTAAAQAALEGQATWVQLGAGNDLAARMPGTWERVRQAIRDNMDQTPVLAGAPLIVRETLLFPYLSGAELARAVAGAGHPDSVALRLPASTEQVLHAEAYLGRGAGGPDVPTTVTLPLAPGAAVAENTLGEFETRLLLFQHSQDLAGAARAAAGWDGDRWAMVRTGAAGEALVWVTVWDTPLDAAEFYDALAQMVPARYPGANAAVSGAAASATARAPGNAAPSAAPTTRVFAAPSAGGARSVTVRAGEVQGRPVVVYVDAPAGAPAELVDLARVTLRQ